MTTATNRPPSPGTIELVHLRLRQASTIIPDETATALARLVEEFAQDAAEDAYREGVEDGWEQGQRAALREGP